MPDDNSGGKPHVTTCIECGEPAIYWIAMGFGWAYLCELCYTQYVAHIREGMIDCPPVKIA